MKRSAILSVIILVSILVIVPQLMVVTLNDNESTVGFFDDLESTLASVFNQPTDTTISDVDNEVTTTGKNKMQNSETIDFEKEEDESLKETQDVDDESDESYHEEEEPVNQIIIGDINGDGYVDEKDESIIEGYWGLSPPYVLKQPDLDGDSTVDIDDVFELLGHWGPCDESYFADINGDLNVDKKDEYIIEGYWGLGPEYRLHDSPDLDEDGTVDIDDVFFLLGQWT